MTSVDFSLPVSFQDLEGALVQPEYNVEEIVNGGLLEECSNSLCSEGDYSIESCFPVYYHLLRQFPSVPSSVRVSYWDVLTEGLKDLCHTLSECDVTNLQSSQKQCHRNKLKMIVYLLVQWVEVSENNTPKKQSSWKTGKELAIDLLSELMVLPLPSLWDPPSPSMMDDLSGIVGTCCYKVLENNSITREKVLLDKTVHLLGVLVRDYGQGLSFCLKVTQLLHHFEHLVTPLSQAVVLLAKDYGTKSVISDIIRELGAKDPKDLAIDASGTRCFAAFLVDVSSSVPELVLPIVSVLMPHLGGESYTFRNGILSVFGHLLVYLSKGQGSTTARDQLLSRLMEHVHDCNAFVRVRVVQTLQHLISSQAVPLHSLQEIVDLVSGRLTDKSSSVRKASLHLLTMAVESNPFASKLETDVFKSKLEEEETKLNILVQERVVSGDTGEGVSDDTGESVSSEVEKELTKQLAVVNYLRNAMKFLDTLCKHIPLIVQMLGSKVTSDILEAINFLSRCSSFGISSAQSGVQRSLGLIWSGDAAVRKAVLDVYVKLYLESDGQGNTDRAVADNLMALVKVSSRGQLASLEKLMGMLVKGDFITAPVIKCLWDSFQQRSAESALAVQVLSMAASVQPNIINNNFDLLIKNGLNSLDLVLTERTCSALNKMSASSLAGGKPLPVDHPLFSQLQHLLLDHLGDLLTSQWPPLTEQSVSCVFKLCVSPVSFCQGLLATITQRVFTEDANTGSSVVLSRLLFTAGVVAHHLMLYCETTVSKELKQRAVRDEGKQINKDGDELALAGASGDDPVIELVRKVLDNEVGGVNGLLSTFEPLMIDVLVNPTKYPCPHLNNSASLALAKYMLISPFLCEKYLRLFFTVLEKSKLESVRANGVITASDLACRFPNLIEPWTPYLYARLTDESTRVRRNTLTVLTHLILNDMIKVRGQISSIALCIEDSDPKIADLAKHFFHELAAKGNTLYNVIPDIISSLSGGDSPTQQTTFHAIVKYIFGLIQKDKQCESLVEKLCHRFRAARNDRQARDLAHCISQLSVSDRCVRRLQDNLSCYKDWLADDVIFECFTSMLTRAKKFTKPEVKGQIDELERLMKEAHEKGMDTSIKEDDAEEPSGSENEDDKGQGSPDDFTRDVLSSARRSLVRSTPRSVIRKGQRRVHASLSEDSSEDEDMLRSPVHVPKLELSF